MQIEGRNPVLESLHSKREFERLKVQEGIKIDMKIKRILDLARSKKIYIEEVPKKKLDKMSETGVHQGVIAIARERKPKTFEELLKMIQDKGEQPFLIYIREVLYEHNLGAIIRSAECAGVQGVIVPPSTEISAQVIRASMGASEHVQIVKGSLFQIIKEAQKNGIKTVGIEISGEKSLYKTDLRGPVMIFVGGEDRGLSKEIIDKLDETVKIPMRGKVNSLNMSVAAAITIYEKVRQDQ
jgi:23S rRNA (guanosine2251-2'-O)-methyltransferase